MGACGLVKPSPFEVPLNKVSSKRTISQLFSALIRKNSFISHLQRSCESFKTSENHKRYI